MSCVVVIEEMNFEKKCKSVKLAEKVALDLRDTFNHPVYIRDKAGQNLEIIATDKFPWFTKASFIFDY